jgi:hypothetical protein
VNEPPPRFSHWHISDVPSAIEGLVLSCLSKSPADRPESAWALIEAYQLALGRPLLSEQAVASSLHRAVSSLHELQWYDPRCMIDQFEASMIEQIAAMKLRGFVDGVGGRVTESDAGVIKVQLPRVVEAPAKKGLMRWLAPRIEHEIDWISLELHMARRDAGSRSVVEITVVHPEECAERKKTCRPFCDQICLELRAYLMVGR